MIRPKNADLHRRRAIARVRRGLEAALCFALLGAFSHAAAQPATDASKRADTLFNEAKELQRKGDWLAACPKYEESQRLDPSASTLIRIGKCHEHDEKFVAARTTYEQALELNTSAKYDKEERRRELEVYARKLLAELQPRFAHLRIFMPRPVPGSSVTRDGEPFVLGAVPRTVDVDPGEHVVVASAPGHVERRTVVTVNEGQTLDVEIALDAVPSPVPVPSQSSSASPAALPAAPAAGLPAAAAPPHDASADEPGASAQWSVGIGVGVAGLVALGAGAGLGIATLAKVETSSAECNADNQCTQAGLDLRDEARALQSAGIGLVAGGAAALTAGIVVFLTAPAPASPAAEPTASSTLFVLPETGGASIRFHRAF